MPTLPSHVSAALQEFKERILRLYGERLRGVYLYGSYARGDYHNGSDVDVAIVLAGEVDISAELDRVGPIASDISLRYDLLLSVLPIPEQWWAQRQSPLLLNLRKEGVAL